jgi:hypothetical protein
MRAEVLCVTPVTLRVSRDRSELAGDAALQGMPLCVFPSGMLYFLIKVEPSILSFVMGGRPTGRSSSPGRGKIFLSSTSPRPVLGPTQPPIQWVPGALSPRVKRPGR